MLAAVAILLHGDAEFSWTAWPVHLSTLIGCGVFLWLYYMATGPWRTRYRLGAPPTPAQRVSFTAGVIVIMLSLNGPLHELADNYLFSAHMVQHLLLTLLMPPLLLYGCPEWLLRLIIRRTTGHALARALTHPLIAFGIYNVVFAGWHLPLFYNWALESHNVHIVQHLMFMSAAVLVWWPVLDPVPELVRMPSPLRMVYLFALSIPMSIVSAMITLSEDVLYAWYGDAPRVFALGALDDQQLGGLIMWVPGALVFWAAITVIFYKWATRENREEVAQRVLLGGSPN